MAEASFASPEEVSKKSLAKNHAKILAQFAKDIGVPTELGALISAYAETKGSEFMAALMSKRDIANKDRDAEIPRRNPLEVLAQSVSRAVSEGFGEPVRARVATDWIVKLVGSADASVVAHAEPLYVATAEPEFRQMKDGQPTPVSVSYVGYARTDDGAPTLTSVVSAGYSEAANV